MPLAVFGFAAGAVPIWHDLLCGKAEKQVMAKFPHFGGVEPDWEANFKITGGCTTSFVVEATPEEVRAFYQERLTRSGWSVQAGPDNSFPMQLEADHEDLRFSLMFEGAESAGPLTQEQVEKQKQAQDQAATAGATCPDCAPELQPGQTRVSISGGQNH